MPCRSTSLGRVEEIRAIELSLTVYATRAAHWRRLVKILIRRYGYNKVVYKADQNPTVSEIL